MPKWNKRTGLWLIISPVIGLVASLLIYAITSFVMASLPNESLETYVVVGQVINVVCGLLGVLSVFGFFVTTPLGFFHYLNARRFHKANGKEKPSLTEAEIEQQIRRWNWGAFLFGAIWGLSNGVWVSLLSFVPIVNLVFMFYLGARGNELAWKAGFWDSVSSFHKTQRRWSVPALIFAGLVLLSILVQIALPNTAQDTEQTAATVCNKLVRSYYNGTAEEAELRTYFDRGCFLEAGCMDGVEDPDFSAEFDYCNRPYYDSCYDNIDQRIEKYIQSSVDTCVAEATATE